MKGELTALEEPLKQGHILRITNTQNNKRAASLEDPTKPEFEQEHSYHDDITLPFALRGLAKTFSSSRGYTQTPCRIGSASGIDACDWWILDKNTLLARYKEGRFIFSAMKSIYTEDEYRRGEGDTLNQAYEELKSSL